ncbi:carbohydrate sulfotransferase 1-like [Amphiura filiformis]|uniref:carbohydrate sulfotransferase 1-like n=1 Tax=Amphiura filiformis TaxID=82378 RepID=UPI003B228599
MSKRPGWHKMFVIFATTVIVFVLYTLYMAPSEKLEQPVRDVALNGNIGQDEQPVKDVAINGNVGHGDFITTSGGEKYRSSNLIENRKLSPLNKNTFEQNVSTDYPKLPPLTQSEHFETNLNLSLADERPLKVIIVTQIRSGSSFTGELFNSNDDFMYIFEPLFDFRKQIDETKTNHRKIIETPLRDLLQCDFKNMSNDWKNWNPASFGPRQQCEMSKSIKFSSLCNYSVIENMYRPIPEDFLRDISRVSVLEDICKSNKYVAIKTIRVYDINDLKNLINDSSVNIKLIHLVRDPRGLHNSRKAVCESNWLDCKMPISCKKLQHNIQFWLDTPDWLKDKYLLVRYEDLAIYPHQFSVQIYKFLNILMPNSVSNWLLENTKHSHGNPYSHTRDSQLVATKWRTQLDMSEVQHVQHHCGAVMEQLGYKKVNSYEALRNSSYSVLEPLNLITH